MSFENLSLLVPYRDDGGHRAEVWNWLKRYWVEVLPGVEICEGTDEGVPFSKAVAVNRAARVAHGSVFAIIDADVYFPPGTMQATLDALKRRKWAMPYGEAFKLTRAYTDRVIASSPRHSLRLSQLGFGLSRAGRREKPFRPNGVWEFRLPNKWGGMCQIMPRTAFEDLGGIDERFRGFGHEDTAFMRALQKLVGNPECLYHEIYHLWHYSLGDGTSGGRQWKDQIGVRVNNELGRRYLAAYKDPDPRVMRALMREWQT